MREAKAGRFEDGGRRGGGGGQSETTDGSQGIRAVWGTGARAPAGHRVAATRSDGVGSAVASLRDSMELP